MVKIDDLRQEVGTLNSSYDLKADEIKQAKVDLEKTAAEVNKGRDHARWLGSTLDSMPASLEPELDADTIDFMCDQVQNQNQMLAETKLSFQSPGPGVLCSGTLTSTTASIGSFIAAASRNPDQVVQSWSVKVVGDYREISQIDQLASSVETRLRRFFSGRLDELSNAMREYQVYRTGGGNPTAIAISLRNVLEQLFGDLMQKARQQPGKKIKWTDVANRLAIGGRSSYQASQLTAQEFTYRSLFDSLTHLAKATAPSGVDIEATVATFLNFCDTLFSLIDPQFL